MQIEVLGFELADDITDNAGMASSCANKMLTTKTQIRTGVILWMATEWCRFDLALFFSRCGHVLTLTLSEKNYMRTYTTRYIQVLAFAVFRPVISGERQLPVCTPCANVCQAFSL